MSAAVDTAVSFQVTMNVSDVERSLRFYRAMLAREPVLVSADEIRFELEEPPLILGLARSDQKGGSLNHVGFRLADSAALVQMQRRLEEAGMPTQRQEGVECCYARQTKFWVTDPDRNLWEIYVFEEDIDHSGFENAPWNAPESAPTAVWEHRLTEPVPARLPHADQTIDEVRLEGTLNARPDIVRPEALLAEACRVLRPGGRIVIHGLAGSRVMESPRLPGLAALVQYVPGIAETLAQLGRAGFVNMYFEKLADVACLPVDGLNLYEMRLEAWRPLGSSATQQRVLYQGPLESVTDDEGVVFPRGVPVLVPEGKWLTLQQSPAAAQFVRLTSK